jgi:leucine-rich repeat transmembrane protein FLRT
MKDGKVINTKTQNNFIISNEGNLILSQARLTDMGNYTCGAQNVASKRLSEPARLTVYGKFISVTIFIKNIFF